jgi:hypothetical protein
MKKLIVRLFTGLVVCIIIGCAAVSQKAYYVEHPTSAQELVARYGISKDITKLGDGSERWNYPAGTSNYGGRYFIIQNDRVIDGGSL